MKAIQEWLWRQSSAVVVLIAASLTTLSGCAGNRLLTEPPPVASREPGNQRNKATLRTHTILKVGSIGTEKMLKAFDGSMMRLLGYEARIVHADGSLEHYNRVFLMQERRR